MSDGTLAVDQGTMAAEATSISNAKQYFGAEALSFTDSESTIDANKKGQKVFTTAQESKQSLGAAVDQEVQNIQSLGLAFAEFDDMIAAANRKQQ